MESSSEEKTLDASAKKLRDQRKKGNVFNKTGLVDGLVFLVTISYLFVNRNEFSEVFTKIYTSQLEEMDSVNTGLSLRYVVLAFQEAALFLVPMVILSLGCVVLVHAVAERGFIFAVDKLAFNANFLSFSNYFKNMFSARRSFETATSVLKLASGVATGIIYFAYRAEAFIRLLLLDPRQQFLLVFRMLVEIVGLLALIFLLFAVIDYLVQKRLYLREQKMTKTEARREYIDTQGNPQMKSSFQSHRKQLLSQTDNEIRFATVVISGRDHSVALRYVPGETPLPVVVAKGTSRQAEEVNEFATKNDIKIVSEHGLARKLFEDLEKGQVINPEHFSDVARALR